MKKLKWYRTRYAVYKLTAHLVFVVKYRKKVFTSLSLSFVRKVFDRVCKDMGCRLVAFGGEADHVHALVSFGPQVELSKLVGRLKGASSHEIRKVFGLQIRRKLWGKHLWSPSYCLVSCGGAPLEVIKEYVKNQGRA